jgi:hypothetical protein
MRRSGIQCHRMARTSDVRSDQKHIPASMISPLNVEWYRSSFNGSMVRRPLSEFNAVADRLFAIVYDPCFDLFFLLELTRRDANGYLCGSNAAQDKHHHEHGQRSVECTFHGNHPLAFAFFTSSISGGTMSNRFPTIA